MFNQKQGGLDYVPNIKKQNDAIIMERILQQR